MYRSVLRYTPNGPLILGIARLCWKHAASIAAQATVSFLSRYWGFRSYAVANALSEATKLFKVNSYALCLGDFQVGGGPKWGVCFFFVTSKWRADDAMSLDSQGRANPAFSKPCLCLSDIHHFRLIFDVFGGPRCEALACFQWVECKFVKWGRFPQNGPLLVGRGQEQSLPKTLVSPRDFDTTNYCVCKRQAFFCVTSWALFRQF